MFPIFIARLCETWSLSPPSAMGQGPKCDGRGCFASPKRGRLRHFRLLKQKFPHSILFWSRFVEADRDVVLCRGGILTALPSCKKKSTSENLFSPAHERKTGRKYRKTRCFWRKTRNFSVKHGSSQEAQQLNFFIRESGAQTSDSIVTQLA